jgi:hypothetical protein
MSSITLIPELLVFDYIEWKIYNENEGITTKIKNLKEWNKNKIF